MLLTSTYYSPSRTYRSVTSHAFFHTSPPFRPHSPPGPALRIRGGRHHLSLPAVLGRAARHAQRAARSAGAVLRLEPGNHFAGGSHRHLLLRHGGPLCRGRHGPFRPAPRAADGPGRD